MVILTFRRVFALGVVIAALAQGLVSARTLYGTQVVISGQPITQLGFIVVDSGGPVLVQVKPPGFTDDKPPRIRRLGPNPVPITFMVGDLLSSDKRVAGVSVRYYEITRPEAEMQSFSLGEKPESGSKILVWNAEKQMAVAEQVDVGPDAVLRAYSKLKPQYVVGAPLCTTDGRAYGVIVGAGDNEFFWRYELLQDRATHAKQLKKALVPLSRATRPMRITPLSEMNTKLPLSVRPERPCVEIHGVEGQVVFRGRNSGGDKVFKMLDPLFQSAVQEGTLDRLVPGGVFTYSPLGTLNVPVKVVDFPLLGQDYTGTCWVAHYREWLFYYLGTRHALIPALDDLRGYLNLVTEPVTVERLFDPARGKKAYVFGGHEPYASKNSVMMRNNLDVFFREFLVGVETEPHVDFNNITRDYTDLRATQKARKLSEQEFGEIMRGLLLGQMTLARSESHVMNLLGFDRNEVMISTWQREIKGTMRQLAQADPRGPLLMPLEFNQHTVVARAPDGNVVIPALDLGKASGLDELKRREVERFNAGE